MSELKCPFCGAELEKETAGDIETGRLVCCTKNCPVIDQNLFPDVWELLIDGKKAQDALKNVKEYYVIVRGYGKEQHYISYSTGAEWYWNWDLDHAEPYDTVQDAKDQIRVAKIPHARVVKVRRLTEITSITKQGNKK